MNIDTASRFAYDNKEGWRLSVITRLVSFYAICLYEGVYAVQYILAHGDVQTLWPHQVGIGTAITIFAILDGLSGRLPKKYQHLPFAKRGEYFYFLIGGLTTVALLWDKAFNKAAIFAVVTLGIATWMHLKAWRAVDGDTRDAEFQEIIPHTPSKRALRRKKNKHKRK